MLKLSFSYGKKFHFFWLGPPLWFEKSKNIKLKKGSMFFDINFLKEVVYLFKILNYSVEKFVWGRAFVTVIEATPLNVTQRFTGKDAVLKCPKAF